jgi:hypothetical protein
MRLLVLAVSALLALVLAASAAAADFGPWVSECVPQYPVGAARTSETCGATLLEGRAISPRQAPPRVKAAIAAANRIDRTPYVWGGGHLGWSARGYDCSGAVGYALHGAGLLDVTMVSGQMESWGAPGVGRWITIYANSQHVFMTIAGLRFDTRDDPPGVSGPRWHPEMVGWEGFVARHPPGL